MVPIKSPNRSIVSDRVLFPVINPNESPLHLLPQTGMSDRRPCPCPPCKATGSTQIPRTIRRHLEAHPVPKPAFLRSPPLDIARPSVSRHSSTIMSSENDYPPSPNRSPTNQAMGDEFDADAGLSDINNNVSQAASPVSLDEEFAGLDFRNRSRESLIRSPSPSGSEPSDRSVR